MATQFRPEWFRKQTLASPTIGAPHPLRVRRTGIPYIPWRADLGPSPDYGSSDFETPKTLAIALTQPENALVFGGYAAVVLLVGTVLLYRRDTN